MVNKVLCINSYINKTNLECYIVRLGLPASREREFAETVTLYFLT